jgi:hypothetical protein
MPTTACRSRRRVAARCAGRRRPNSSFRGAAKAAIPESITTAAAEYGFRARDFVAPRNDGRVSLQTSIIVLARHLRSEVCCFPHPEMREAERRQALGCLRGTLGRASDVGPQALARRLASRTDPLAQSARRGRSPLGAPPRRFVGPEPALVKPSGGAQRGGALGPHIGAFTRSARSGGRAGFPGSLPGAWLRASPQDAASRSAFGSSPEDALGEGDVASIRPPRNNVKDKIPWKPPRRLRWAQPR